MLAIRAAWFGLGSCGIDFLQLSASSASSTAPRYGNNTMANFHTHVTFSSVIGCGYAAVGSSMGIPLETALIGGGLCGLSGMLPDLDSDSGIPLRESMAFAAAVVPMLLVDRLRTLGLGHDGIVFTAALMYFLVRFGVAKMIARRTKHRGMFHSIPAALIFAGAAFLLCDWGEITMRYYKAGGVLLGVMSHLLLDEIYSIEWKGGRWRLKKSFGTAIKFWSKDTYSNISTYAKLGVIVMLILGEPAMMERLERRSPAIANTVRQIQQRVPSSPQRSPFAEPNGNDQQMVEYPQGTPGYGEGVYPQPPSPYGHGANYFTPGEYPPAFHPPAPEPPADETIYDTARRFFRQLTGAEDETRR